MILGSRCAQEEVLKIMYQHGVSTTELANYLGCSVQLLSYQLNAAKKFDSDMERLIYKYFAKKGITLNQTGEIILIAKQVLEHTAITNQMLAMLTNNIQNVIDDEKLTDDEREQILNKLDYFESEIVTSVNILRSIVRGRIKPANKIYEMAR